MKTQQQFAAMNAFQQVQQDIGPLWELTNDVRQLKGLQAGGRMAKALRDLEAAADAARRVWAQELELSGDGPEARRHFILDESTAAG